YPSPRLVAAFAVVFEDDFDVVVVLAFVELVGGTNWLFHWFTSSAGKPGGAAAATSLLASTSFVMLHVSLSAAKKPTEPVFPASLPWIVAMATVEARLQLSSAMVASANLPLAASVIFSLVQEAPPTVVVIRMRVVLVGRAEPSAATFSCELHAAAAPAARKTTSAAGGAAGRGLPRIPPPPQLTGSRVLTRPRAVVTPTLLQHGEVDHDTPALALRADAGQRLEEALPDPLARHLDQAEVGDVEHLGAGLVAGERLTERGDHGPP